MLSLWDLETLVHGGYIILNSLPTSYLYLRYAACFLSISGGGAAGPLVLGWATENAAPDTVRAVTTGMIPGQLRLCSALN